MSAAAPAPPPHRHLVSQAPRGYANSEQPISSERSGAGGSTVPNGGPGHNYSPPSRPFPHLRDLVVRAEKQVEQHGRTTIESRLGRAYTALKNADVFLDSRRPDQAYVEYLIAYQIVVTLDDNDGRHHQTKDLRRTILTQEERYDKIRDMIKADNQRNGMRPSLVANSPSEPPRYINPDTFAELDSNSRDNRPSSVQIPASLRSGPSHASPQQRSSFPVSSRSDHYRQERSDRTSTHHQYRDQHQKGHVPGGTAAINGYHDGSNASHPSHDSITARFAKLRVGNRPAESVSRVYHPPFQSNASQESATSARSAEDYRYEERPVSHVNTDPLSNAHVNSTRPSSVESNSSIASLPRIGRNNALESGGRPHLRGRNRTKSIHEPRETEIEAERLYDYLQHFNVLLIDVRHRQEYDQGHIFTKSGMCIEPAALRPGMSAEQLQDSLVLSPEEEQVFFDRRNEFDLVVYYDQSSTSCNYSSRHPMQNPAMRYLREALYEYNQEKPLQWAPILLKGGLDAWIELVGKQALHTSSTAHRNRGSRLISRRPGADAASRIDMQKRRRREYNPLDPEEERKWRERARSESVVVPSMPQEEDRPSSSLTREQSIQSPALEEFQRRFPDVASVEQQSMRSQSPSRPPERQPPQIPQYPKPPAPTHSSVPSIPSRPAPIVTRPSFAGVMEKSQTQSPPTTKPSQLAPYIPPKLKRLPRTGLHNFGVTCYMNATIQCLSATLPLTFFFLDGQFNRYLQKENWKGSKGLMPELYDVLLKNMWHSQDADIIRPTNFRKFCARLNQEWGVDRQQDAKEFLEFLLDCLHEDLNVNWRRNPLRALTAEQEAERERTPPFIASQREWERYLHRDNSRLTDLFAGQHISRLQCTTCKRSSTTYEPFYSISVEIPSNSRTVDIRDCLRSYCSSEMLSGEEVWKCPFCRCEREATKRITISRAPNFLVVHFKRFSASHSEKARKITTPVEFPIKDLDLEPFMLPEPEGENMNEIQRRHPRAAEVPASMRPPFKYDAYAVMRHLGGTIASGHYISLVQDRARGCWREFNDDRVTDFKPENLPPSKRLQNEQAYIVFYQRQALMNGV
ncbi:MAG: ubiquitin-specific protease doa4 [Alyxoria varia]|nr:MAG: ubiquitin-specific protease doa4 [Alyxoria varia]